MRIPRISLGKYFWGIGACMITFLVGAWLIVAPFALAYQQYGADWSDQTKNDFWLGIVVALVSLAGIVIFIRTLMNELQNAGIMPRPQQAMVVETPGPIPAQAAAQPESELDRTLAALAASLAADLAERRRAENPSLNGGLNTNPNAHNTNAHTLSTDIRRES